MSFKDIKGQDRPIHILQGYIEQSRLEGGYLFIGPEGVGKKLAAKQLAKQVNCSQDSFDTSTTLSVNGERPSTPLGTSPEFIEGRSRTIDSCDRCVSCMKIENSQHPDVHVIDDSETEIKIEYIRQLQRDISLRPYEGKRKVFIIDNAHRLTAEAQGAILKALEEPPAGSLIILISDKPALLFKTIISRCKIVKFFPLSRMRLEVLFKKDYGLDNNTAHFVAYFSEGRFGRALRLKDTDVLRQKNTIIDRFVLSRRPYDLANFPIEDKEGVRGMLNILAAWFRDIYLIKVGLPYSEIINSDRKDELLKLMGSFSFLDLNEILYSISDSILYLERNINVKLLLSNLRSLLCKA